MTGLAAVLILGPFAAESAAVEGCQCSFTDQFPWSGPPTQEQDLLADTCEVDPTLPACVRVWDEGSVPDAEVCANDQTGWDYCVWTTPEGDGEPGGFLDEESPDNNDWSEAGVCADFGPADDFQEPDACVNEWGDPGCLESEVCDPSTNQNYQPEDCLAWVAPNDCLHTEA